MMRLPRFEYIAPTTIDKVLSLLDEYGSEARILAGGTDLLVAAKLRNEQPRYLISLKKIDELKGIVHSEGEGLKIGAMTPLYHVRQDPTIRQYYRALAQAAAVVGTPQLQRMGTLGGNLCLNTRCCYYNQSSAWRQHRPACLKMGGDRCHVAPKGKKCLAVFSADTPPALIALGARLKLVSAAGERLLPINDFYTGDGKTPLALRRGEILTQIELPEPNPKRHSVYLKYRMRKAIDFPLVGVAAVMPSEGNGTCGTGRIVLNAVGSAPTIVSEVESLLKNPVSSSDVIAKIGEMSSRSAHPVANADSTPTYRRKMAGILTRRAIEELSKSNEESLEP